MSRLLILVLFLLCGFSSFAEDESEIIVTQNNFAQKCKTLYTANGKKRVRLKKIDDQVKKYQTQCDEQARIAYEGYQAEKSSFVDEDALEQESDIILADINSDIIDSEENKKVVTRYFETIYALKIQKDSNGIDAGMISLSEGTIVPIGDSSFPEFETERSKEYQKFIPANNNAKQVEVANTKVDVLNLDKVKSLYKSLSSESEYIMIGDTEQTSQIIYKENFLKKLAVMATLRSCFGVEFEGKTIKTSRRDEVSLAECQYNIDLSLSGKSKLFGQLAKPIILKKYVKLNLILSNREKLGAFRPNGDNYFSAMGGGYCVRSSALTVDYDECVKAVKATLATGLINQGGGVVSSMASTISNQNIQNDYQRDIQSGKDQYEAGMDLQRRQLKTQRDVHIAQTGVFSAGATSLTSISAKIPTPKTFSNKCESDDRSQRIYYCSLMQMYDDDKSDVSGMFANTQVKGQMMAQSANLIGESLKHGLQAWSFGEAMKKLQTMKDEYNTALSEVAEFDTPLDPCFENPDAQGCEQSDVETSSNQFQMGSLNFGGTASNFAASNLDDTLDSQQAASAGGKSSTSVGDIFGDKDELNEKFKQIGAGKLKSASRGGAAGGGGGGAGLGGGGGGSAGAAGVAGGSSASGYKSVKAGYGKVGSSGISYKRVGKAKKRRSKDPYGNLFNKDKPQRNIASEANDIGDRKSGLFEKISKRYNKLSSTNRLKKF
ncbi:MAG: hypothetical protein N4A33_00560 [Bacteriovoracaceae bacterium]|jgi:hypothetical protein|nr:hypothetical protein [Bacteriovoracaceae bacterium]